MVNTLDDNVKVVNDTLSSLKIMIEQMLEENVDIHDEPAIAELVSQKYAIVNAIDHGKKVIQKLEELE